MELGWFSALFMVATVAALMTGQAYYRGTIDRDEEPGRYWSAVASYVALALLAPVIEILRRLGVGR